MSRAKRGFKARRRHNRILKLAKGYRGSHSRLFRSAVEAVERGLCYAYRDRRQRLAALAAPFLRYAPARGRRRPAFDPGAARALERLDDAGLHARGAVAIAQAI